MQTTCARANQVLAGAPLDNGNVNPCQRQLTCQHQPRRAASSDNNRMVGHLFDVSTRPTRRRQHRHSTTPISAVLVSASDSAAPPGSCRKPPGGLYVESGRGGTPPFPFLVR